MDEQLFGPHIYNSSGLTAYLNAYIVYARGKKGDCESQSLTLARYLSAVSNKVFVAQWESKHTVVYLNHEYWIDIAIGLVWNKDRTKYYPLDNFNQDEYDYQYEMLEMNDDMIFLKIVDVHKSLVIL